MTPVVPASEPVPEDPLCRGGAGVTVEELPDVTIPAVEIPAVTDPDDGTVLVPAVTVPAQVAEAGCVVRHDAPGGCVGAVDISAAGIPAVTIPAATTRRSRLPRLTIPRSSSPEPGPRRCARSRRPTGCPP